MRDVRAFFLFFFFMCLYPVPSVNTFPRESCVAFMYIPARAVQTFWLFPFRVSSFGERFLFFNFLGLCLHLFRWFATGSPWALDHSTQVSPLSPSGGRVSNIHIDNWKKKRCLVHVYRPPLPHFQIEPISLIYYQFESLYRPWKESKQHWICVCTCVMYVTQASPFRLALSKQSKKSVAWHRSSWTASVHSQPTDHNSFFFYLFIYFFRLKRKGPPV